MPDQHPGAHVELLSSTYASPEPAAFVLKNPLGSAKLKLNERIGLLTGQSLPILRCGRKRRFNADRQALNDQ